LDPTHIPVEFDPPTATGTKAPADKKAVEEFTPRESKKPAAELTPAAKPSGPPKVSARPANATFAGEISLEPDDASEFAPRTPAPSAKPTDAPAVQGALSAAQLEKIIREQSADVIESVVWKVIPELATQIIERELKKLLQERDSHPY
jgi:hypothetical protein